MGWARPRQIALLLADALAQGKTKAGVDHLAHRLKSRTRLLKSVENPANGRLHRRIWVETKHPVVLVHETDGRVHSELASAGLVEYAPSHPGPDNVQLRFAHRALQS